jgi:hypothetical protein
LSQEQLPLVLLLLRSGQSFCVAIPESSIRSSHALTSPLTN